MAIDRPFWIATREEDVVWNPPHLVDQFVYEGGLADRLISSIKACGFYEKTPFREFCVIFDVKTDAQPGFRFEGSKETQTLTVREDAPFGDLIDSEPEVQNEFFEEETLKALLIVAYMYKLDAAPLKALYAELDAQSAENFIAVLAEHDPSVSMILDQGDEGHPGLNFLKP